MNFLSYLESILGNYPLLFGVTCISFLLKVSILTALARKTITLSSVKRPWFFLLLVLISASITDSAWIIKLIELFIIPSIDYRIVLFWIRIAWAFFVIQYQSMGLFIESLVTKRYSLSLHQKIFCFISCIFVIYFIGTAIFNFNCFSPADRSQIERTIQPICSFYLLFIIMASSLFITIRKIQNSPLPHILKKQLKLLIQALIIPHLISEIIHMYPFQVYNPTFITQSFAFVTVSTLLLTYAIFFCTRKIMGLRFLNLHNHVQHPTQLSFIDDFKIILERLSLVTNLRELGHITQSFLKETLNIPITKTKFYLRNIDLQQKVEHTHCIDDNIPDLIETFISTHAPNVKSFIKKQQILLYDEIAFTHFYNETEESKSVLNFLNSINADVFLPIYQNDVLVAYIVVERNARNNQFYSNVERDELIVYASYLGNIINLLQNKSFDVLIEQEQSLQTELYHKHQEINQYKESIRSFLRISRQKQIGVIYYKNRHFTFGNQEAKQLVDLNINTQQGHPLTHAFKRIATQVEAYKAPQSTFANDTHGKPLVLSAVPHLDQNNVIITVSYPNVSDVIKQQMDLLKDPTEWDYLLYLETTQSGKLINKLIPGTGPTLLNFKIELLKIALSRKAILLDMPNKDLMPTVELLHHVSLRENLHVLNLQGLSKNFDVAITLFGINPIFGLDQKDQQSLLDKLDSVGTLFIKNIHLLDIETQEYLAEFIRYGFYRIFKSEQKVSSNVRIIVSSNQKLQNLVQEGKFSKELFAELKKTALAMPSLLTLPKDELNTLADGFTQQALETDAFQNLLALTSKEKNKLTYNRPTSLQELKVKVQNMLIKKSKKNQIYQETQFDPTYEVTDPELMQAARLGKQALKDRSIMTLLWNKFQNQNKIATFLGVNRSSVNRRCKEYNLI